MKKLFTLLFIAVSANSFAQQLGALTVEKIMRDPKWIGTSPSDIHWSDDSKKLYFTWNPKGADRDSLYSITTGNTSPEAVSLGERKAMVPEGGEWNKKHTLKLFEKYGDIFLSDIPKGKIIRLTNTTDRESNPRFSGDESSIIFVRSENLYSLKLNTGELVQLTNFVHSGATPVAVTGRRGRQGNGANASTGNQQEKWLKDQQLELFDIVKKNDKEKKASEAERKELEPKKLKEINIDDKRLSGLEVSPDGRFVTYRLITSPKDEKRTIVPDYVTASGWTEDIPNREKVGGPQSTSEAFIFDTEKDSVYNVAIADIPGIKDIPAYIKEYPKELEEYTKRNANRDVSVYGPIWSEDGKNAVVVISAEDYKDRWIMKLDAATGHLSLIDREHDDAWIGGPGIGGTRDVAWIDNTHFYYQSEASGYSHIYVADVTNGDKKQITSGKWEVQTLELSKDKKTFYFTANIDHPGVKDYYRMPVSGGTPVKLTSMKGENLVTLSPDEKWLAISYSFTNRPPDLYLQPNKPGATAVKVTNSVSAEYLSYPWRAPEIITFKNRYGSDVYARVYEPKTPDPAKPAVIRTIRGGGYLFSPVGDKA